MVFETDEAGKTTALVTVRRTVTNIFDGMAAAA
jgi:hypothetical protein